MIKICGCAFRKAGLPEAAWLDHYRERHGPLIASLRGYVAHVVAYRQNYVAPSFSHLSTDVIDAPGGVSELWFADLDAASRAFADPEYLDIGRADEAAFVDLSRGISLFGQEHVVLRGNEAAGASWTSRPRHRLLVFRAAAAGRSRQQFQRAWAEAGATMARQDWFALVGRYVQTHTLADADGVLRPARHDLVDEFHFASISDALAFANTSPVILGEEAAMHTNAAETLALVTSSHLVLGR